MIFPPYTINNWSSKTARIIGNVMMDINKPLQTYVGITWSKVSVLLIKLFGLQWQWAPSKNVFGEYQVRFSGNNAWSVRMPLRMSRISRPLFVGRKPV